MKNEVIQDVVVECARCSTRMNEVYKIRVNERGEHICRGWCDRCKAEHDSKPVEILYTERGQAAKN